MVLMYKASVVSVVGATQGRGADHQRVSSSVAADGSLGPVHSKYPDANTMRRRFLNGSRYEGRGVWLARGPNTKPVRSSSPALWPRARLTFRPKSAFSALCSRPGCQFDP